MTPRERVYRALSFQDTDIVPYQVYLNQGTYQNLAEYYGDPDFFGKIGNHLAMISPRKIAAWVEVEPGFWQDEWGVIWNRTVDKDIGVVSNRLIPEPTLKGFEFPEPNSPEVLAGYDGFVESNPDQFRIISIGFSLFERAWTLRGMDNLLVDMIESPEFVHELLDGITEWVLAQVDLAVTLDIDAMQFGDDWGSQNGLIMGPALWREFVKPRVAKIYGRVRDAGKFVFIHSCGDVKSVLPDLVECGLQVFNPFQPEVMDIFETKKKYYNQLSFYGGISVQTLLPHGTPDEVRRETRRLLTELGRGGGYIASPSHSVPVDVPPENLAAMIEVLKGQ